MRPAIKRKYGAALEAMYEEHDRIQEEELAAGCANFQGLVKQLFNGGDIPHLSKAFIDKNLEDMRLLKMIV